MLVNHLCAFVFGKVSTNKAVAVNNKVFLFLDRLMSDNPDYHSILPTSTSLSKQSKKAKLKKLLKDKRDDEDEEDEDEDTSEEMRVCPTCEELLVRHLAKMETGEKTQLTGLYERMWLTMRDADKLKPSYMEMADSLL